jgi:acyl-CoA thioesterase I
MHYCRHLPLLVLLLFCWAGPAQGLTVLFLGDSLTAGMGVEREEAYPHLIGQALQAEGQEDLTIINGGISGSTSASALGRLNWYAQAKPDLLVLALGANDGLRGLPIDQLKDNLSMVVDRAGQMGMSVILAGMEVPPNYGPDYSQAFHDVFPTIAEQNQIPLIPFLLKDVAGNQELNQADGIHPNARGHRVIAQTVLPYIAAGLDQVRKRHQAGPGRTNP